MSEEKLEMVRRLCNSCWAVGDMDLVPQVLDPDIAWTAIESAPDAGTRRGFDECRAYMLDWFESFELEPQVVEIVGTSPDGRLVCSQHATATGKGSDVPVEISYGAVYRFGSDGRIVEIHEYASTSEALVAAGLSE